MKKQCGRREVFKNLRIAQKIDRGHPIQIVFQIDPFIKLNIIKTKKTRNVNKTLNQTSKRKTKNMRQKKLNEYNSALNQSIQ